VLKLGSPEHLLVDQLDDSRSAWTFDPGELGAAEQRGGEQALSSTSWPAPWLTVDHQRFMGAPASQQLQQSDVPEALRGLPDDPGQVSVAGAGPPRVQRRPVRCATPRRWS
jgi:hypothetical protein